jgi:glyoxylase I family protein
MPPALPGLHHGAIIAADRDRALAFHVGARYVGALGLAEVARRWRAARESGTIDLALPGGGQIELFTLPGAPPRPTRPEAQGLRHLALAVADLPARIAHLAARGIAAEPVRPDPLTGARFTVVADPDGLPVGLVARAAGVAPPAAPA